MCWAGLAACCFLMLQSAAYCAVRDEQNEDAYLVGVYYFSGWWREQPNKWTTGGTDWRGHFPERVPLLGQYNDQATMDAEIACASRHGVDFFQMLWYPRIAGVDEPHRQHLNDGTRFFVSSPYRNRMRFTLEYVNHAPFNLADDEQWQSACSEWAACMKLPSYLRLNGRPVFKIHGLGQFRDECGNDPEKIASRLLTLRKTVRRICGADPLVGAGVSPCAVPEAQAVQGFDYLTTYMDVPRLPARAQPYPYQQLLALAVDGWKLYADTSPLPYVPYVPVGWDPRPWKDPRPAFESPTREEWLGTLRSVKSILDGSKGLGIALADGSRTRMLLIYAWNEYGEGGILAPTRLRGTQRLEAVKSVFPDVPQRIQD